jgi:hypothetical protein
MWTTSKESGLLGAYLLATLASVLMCMCKTAVLQENGGLKIYAFTYLRVRFSIPFVAGHAATAVNV